MPILDLLAQSARCHRFRQPNPLAPLPTPEMAHLYRSLRLVNHWCVLVVAAYIGSLVDPIQCTGPFLPFFRFLQVALKLFVSPLLLKGSAQWRITRFHSSK